MSSPVYRNCIDKVCGMSCLLSGVFERENDQRIFGGLKFSILEFSDGKS